MKKLIFIFFLLLSVSTLHSKYININFRNLTIEQLIEIVSDNLNTNILYSGELKERVNFYSNKKIESELLLKILESSLNDIGKSLIKVENFYKVIDKPILNLSNRKIEIIELINSNVLEIKPTLETLIKSKTFFEEKELITISYEIESNSLILAGDKTNIDILKALIKSLDIKKPQVYVKVKIVEISETKGKELGLEYGLRGFNKYSSTTLTSFSSSFNSTSNSAFDFSEFSTYGFDLSSMIKGISLGATINFLKENEVLDLISEPSILCLNNKESSIYVGETKSFKTGQTTNEMGTTESYKREDIGLKLKVKPRISNEKVILEIDTILEDAKETSSTANVDTSKKEIKTVAILNNAETVVIGGLKKSKSIKSESKLPILADIPILGTLFKNEKYLNDKIDLAIVLTPYIIKSNQSISEVKKEIDKLTNLENILLNENLKKLKSVN